MNGKLIVYWSNWHGRGNTSNCIASAMQFSMLNDFESVITHTQYSRSSMEHAFLTGKEDIDIRKFSDFGLDSLERALKTGMLEPEHLNDYCNNIIHKKLEFLPGTKKINEQQFKNSIGQSILNIIEFARNSKDYLFVDLGNPLEDKITNKVLDMADIVFVTLEQSKVVLEDFFKEQIEKLKDKEVILLIGRYDLESKYSIKDIKKEFKYNGEIIGIPFVTEYADALNSHKVKKFFDKYYSLEDEPFFESLNYISNIILNNIE